MSGISIGDCSSDSVDVVDIDDIYGEILGGREYIINGSLKGSSGGFGFTII